MKETMSHSVSTILKKIMSFLEKFRRIGNMVNHEDTSKELEEETKLRIRVKTHLYEPSCPNWPYRVF